MARTLTALVFALIGIALVIPGVWLISLGGSPAYLLIGSGVLVTAILLWRGVAVALPFYALVLIGTMIWALWEVGADWYQLAPRGWLLVLLGIWLFVLERIKPVAERSETRQGTVFAGAVLLSSAAVALWSMMHDPKGLSGHLRADTVNPDPSTGAGFTDADWQVYGRGGYGQRYSPLDQITPGNIGELSEIWRYQTGDLRLPEDVTETTYQVTPLKVGDRLFLCTPHNLAIAVDAATGSEIWRYDARSGMEPDRQHQTCRGVTYWEDDAVIPGTACATRVHMPTATPA